MRKLGEICELKIINVIKNITENNVNQPIFCIFYTIDNGYQEYFRHLKKSLKKFKLDYYDLKFIVETIYGRKLVS